MTNKTPHLLAALEEIRRQLSEPEFQPPAKTLVPKREPMPWDDGRPFISVEEVSRILTLGMTGTFGLLREGVLPRVKIGRRTVVPTQALKAYVDGLIDSASR